MFSQTILLVALAAVACSVVSGTDQAIKEDNVVATEQGNSQENFKEMVYLSLVELTKENRVAPGFVSDADAAARVDKRGRHQGFCFKKTKSGKFVPYICWKDEENA